MARKQQHLEQGRSAAARRGRRALEGCNKDSAFEVLPPSVRPRQMNTLIVDTAEAKDANADSLLLMLGVHLPRMNLVNLSTFMHRLAKLVAKESDIQPAFIAHPVVQTLLSMARKHLAAAKVAANLQQTLSNIAWSLATMQILDVELLELIGTFAMSAMPGFKPFELSTMLWAFAKLGAGNAMPWCAQPLFRAASAQILSSVGQFSFRCLSNIVWAFATAGLQDAGLFFGIAEEMCRTVSSANCQGISNTIWAFGVVHHVDERLFNVLTAASLPMMDDFKPQEISSMLWGMARNGFHTPSVYLRAVAAAQLIYLEPQQLANIIWACSQATPKDPMLETAVVRLFPQCTLLFEGFKIQEISSIFSALLRMLVGEGTEAFASVAKLHLVKSYHPNILAFLRIAAPWVEDNIHNFSDQLFASVSVALAMSGVANSSRLEFAIEQQVFERANALAPKEVLLLLGAFLLAPRFARRAVCVLAANLVYSFKALRPHELLVLQNISSAVQAPQGSQPDQERLYSWCLVLAASLLQDPPEMMPQPTLLPLNHVCLAQYAASGETMKKGVPTYNLFESVDLDSEADTLSCVGSATEVALSNSEFHISTEESLPFLALEEQVYRDGYPACSSMAGVQ